MKTFQNIDNWTDKHHPKILDLLRVILGLIIFIKGVYFISHTSELQQILRNSQFPWISFLIAHYVAIAHLAGGILIAIGLYTRLAVLFQIPILFGAVIFVNAQKGFFTENHDLALSILVLILLIFFFFYGSGSYSADHTWKSEVHEEQAE